MLSQLLVGCWQPLVILGHRVLRAYASVQILFFKDTSHNGLGLSLVTS